MSLSTGSNHQFPADVDIELVSPQGTAVALMSDTCGSAPMAATNLTFDDASATSLPNTNGGCTAGVYKPTDIGAGDTWQVAPTGTTLAAFNGENPNPVNSAIGWRLYVRDDAAGQTGAINTGWSIQITTAATAPITIPAFGVSGGGVAAPYPAPIAVSGVSGLITDVNLTIPGLAHTFPSDLQMVLQSPSGTAVKIMSGDCGSTDVLNKDFTFDDQAATVLPGTCSAGGTFKTTANPLANLPAPAPAGPYGTSLAAFNGQSANGSWKLFINDTAPSDGGWISANPTLTFKTTDVIAPETTFTKKPKTGFKTTSTIKFVSSEAGSHFECKVDTAKKFKPCTSPLKLKHLKFGKHKIQVRAIDAAGNVDPTPLRGKWNIIKKS